MAAQIKLVHITTVPVSLIGLVGGQAGYMQQHGFAVVGISSPGALLQEFAVRQGVSVTGIEMLRRISPLPDTLALWALWRELRRLRPHIVHTHTPKAGLLGTLAAWLASVPIRNYHMHGLRYMTAGGLQRQLLRLAEVAACRLADQVLCVSRSVRDKALAERLCAPEKILIPLEGGYGIDARGRFDPTRHGANDRQAIRSQVEIPGGAIVLGYVGRIVRDKGLIELTAAWHALRGEFETLHLLLAGPFEPQDPLPPEVEAALRADPRVHLAGTVSADDMPRVYAALDVVTLPSYREGFPLSLLEAAAMSLPVVATRVEGCLDAVQDGITGTLVPARDAQALAAAIRRYILQPSLRAEHGRAGRERVLRDFRPEAIYEAIYQEYARLLTARHLPLPGGKTAV